MGEFVVKMSKRALNDLEKLKQSKLSNKAKALVDVLVENPYQNPPPYEKLIGNLRGFYSRRINRQHRLVYFIVEKGKQLGKSHRNNIATQNTIVVCSMWTHYE
ncbi:MAG: Txe/YoeB family addiction module toxin [Planctomycetia bacterium]|nr:Txe/YoeB family addiction module toxin [Planctomycetia bacterium]